MIGRATINEHLIYTWADYFICIILLNPSINLMG